MHFRNRIATQSPQIILWVLVMGAMVYIFREYLAFSPALAFIPFFLGPCGDGECGSASDSGSDGSSGGGDDSGGTGQCTGSCGSNSTGCSPGQCSSGSSDGGTSTPFLFAKKEGAFVPENDVMVGYPQTMQPNRFVGEKQYKEGNIGTDVYTLPHESLNNERFSFELREIEPEETFLDAIKLHAYHIPETSIVTHAWDHSGIRCIDRAEVEQMTFEGVCTTSTQEQHNNLFRYPIEAGEQHVQPSPTALFLEAGEVLDIETTASRHFGSKNVFLLVKSVYRDWTPGEQIRNTVHSTATAIISPFRRVASVLSALVVFLGINAFHSSLLAEEQRAENDRGQQLARAFGIPTAHADTPHSSLIVSYWDWEEKLFKECATVQPRAYRSTLDSLEVPRKALGVRGKVRLRILATKRHAVEALRLVDTEGELAVPQKVTVPSGSVTHSRVGDVTKALQQKHNFVHLVPGDRLSFDFNTGDLPPKTNLVALEVKGFYTPLTQEGKMIAGEWETKLDNVSRSVVERLYPLESYYQKEREPA